MLAMHDEREIQRSLDLKKEERLFDQAIFKMKNDAMIKSRLAKTPMKQLFQATIHAVNIDQNLKMNYLKSMVTRKANEATGLANTAV